MKKLSFVLLFFAIGFNLWLYRLEPTAKVDPNDNTFQYALVERTNQMWDYNKLALFDHWVPNWAEGYNLPYYYSHIPQIVIVASYRFLSFARGPLASLQGVPLGISLFQYYHLIIYLLLCFFPLSMFLALRISGLSWISAGIGALMASQLSTDGLYGLDPASFLWRGYGLSSQLFAMIWLPLAIAYSYRFTQRTNIKAQMSNQFQNPKDKKAKIKFLNFGFDLSFGFWHLDLFKAILFLAATTAGHLGIGIIAFMSTAILGWREPKKLLLIFGGVGLLLGYWILPILLHGNYHNISFWDPVWKFDSYGAIPTLTRLFNGELFDFGRLPILTILIFIGIFASLFSIGHLAFGILFLFWLLMYFGRTTWGPLIDLIPGMADFHLSRFIVGLHMAGLFLIPLAFEKIKQYIGVFVYLFIGLLVVLVYPQTVRYSQYNDVLIKQANINYAKQNSDAESLIIHLKSLISTHPGRVFAGRGGTWGKKLQLAETPYYMHLSTYGIPTVLWLPETWSPNSDIEQYFSEDQAKDYNLYNIRYVVAPTDQEPQKFWEKIQETSSYKLYEVQTDGYITTGIRPATISTTKEHYVNLVRLWIQSDFHKQGLFPELTFDTNYPKTTGLPNFKMLDEVTYKVPDGSTHNLFSEVPSYLGDLSNLGDLKILSQSQEADMVFRASVEVPEGCQECLVILKQTFHPSWQATVDGKRVDTLTVFPFYTAVKLETAGTHEIIFSYKPSILKIFLLIISLITLGFIFWLFLKFHK